MRPGPTPPRGLVWAMLLAATLLGAGCVHIAPRPPAVAPGQQATGVAEVGLVLPDATVSHVEKGLINVAGYSVAWGRSLEVATEFAFRQAFAKVVRLREATPRPGVPVIVVEIVSSKLSPGPFLTSPSSATLRLGARVVRDGGAEPEAIEVEGRGTVTPGMPPGGLVYAPTSGAELTAVNPDLFDRAMQVACELAIRDALAKLLRALSPRLSR